MAKTLQIFCTLFILVGLPSCKNERTVRFETYKQMIQDEFAEKKNDLEILENYPIEIKTLVHSRLDSLENMEEYTIQTIIVYHSRDHDMSFDTLGNFIYRSGEIDRSKYDVSAILFDTNFAAPRRYQFELDLNFNLLSEHGIMISLPRVCH